MLYLFIYQIYNLFMCLFTFLATASSGWMLCKLCIFRYFSLLPSLPIFLLFLSSPFWPIHVVLSSFFLFIIYFILFYLYIYFFNQICLSFDTCQLNYGIAFKLKNLLSTIYCTSKFFSVFFIIDVVCMNANLQVLRIVIWK